MVSGTNHSTELALASDGSMLPTTSKGIRVQATSISSHDQASSSTHRGDMGPPPLPPTHSYTVVSDVASTSTAVDSPPSSDVSDASTSRLTTPSASDSLYRKEGRRPERQHILVKQVNHMCQNLRLSLTYKRIASRAGAGG
jgi:hypothetical protein